MEKVLIWYTCRAAKMKHPISSFKHFETDNAFFVVGYVIGKNRETSFTDDYNYILVISDKQVEYWSYWYGRLKGRWDRRGWKASRLLGFEVSSCEQIIEFGNKEFGIDRNKFINGSVLDLKYFDWQKYIYLYKKRISVVAENCQGGVLQHMLGFPFNSPFINIRVGTFYTDFRKMVENIDSFMMHTPTIQVPDKYADKMKTFEIRCNYPILWYDDIALHGFHYMRHEKMLEVWEKRRYRFDINYMLIIKFILDEDDLRWFEQLPYNFKLGIYFQKTDYDNIITIPWGKDKEMEYAYSFPTYVDNLIRNGKFFEYKDLFSFFYEGVKKCESNIHFKE